MSGPIDPRLESVITSLLTVFAQQATQNDIVLKERFDAAVAEFRAQLDTAVSEFWEDAGTLTVVPEGPTPAGA
jgi:hypothetical protein